MDGVISRIRHCPLFAGLSEDEIRRVLATAERRRIASGQRICRQGERGGSMFIVLDGRVSVSATNRAGDMRVLNHLAQGDHFGELSMLVGAPRTADVTAVFDTDVLEIGNDDFQTLILQIPRFVLNISQTLGRWLHNTLTGERRIAATGVAAVLRSDRVTDQLAVQLAASIPRRRNGEPLHVFSDRPSSWPALPGVSLHPLPMKGSRVELLPFVEAAAAVVDRGGQALLDVPQTSADARLLMQCELAWWLTNHEDSSASVARLKQLVSSDAGLASRLQAVWATRLVQPLAAAVDHGFAVKRPDLRIAFESRDAAAVRFRPHDLARLRRILLGVHCGLALGGGGARGLAHVGVLEALEREGLFFDRLAGTSAGAIVAAAYAAGYPPREILDRLHAELSPPKWTRFVPKGRRVHMLAMFRLGMADRKFRNHLFHYRFEDLLMPVHTVTVDLVSGQRVVRDEGDVVNAVSESINIPGLARPILRDGEALVDGGVLDNLPANVLKDHGCDFVAAVNVGSKLAPQFAGNTADTPTEKMRKAGLWETMVRVVDVQQKGLARLNSDDGDILIAPDTSAVPFDDFTRGEELREAGLREAEEVLPRLKQAMEETERSAELPARRAPSEAAPAKVA